LPSLRIAPKRIEHVADIAVDEIGALCVDHARFILVICVTFDRAVEDSSKR
jgi:hypothetical protein